MGKRVIQYFRDNGAEWTFLVIVVVGAGVVGGYIGATVPTHWFMTGVCG